MEEVKENYNNYTISVRTEEVDRGLLPIVNILHNKAGHAFTKGTVPSPVVEETFESEQEALSYGVEIAKKLIDKSRKKRP